jgi:hypothetical protein
MGNERGWKRKHFYLYLAGCLALLMGSHGCAYISMTTWESKQQLKDAHVLLSKGEFESSLKTSKEVLEKSHAPLGDLALYQIAMAYAHPKNPKSDIKESIRAFQTIGLEFPHSEVKGEADLWALTLTKLLETEKEVQNLRGSLSLSEKAFEESKRMTRAAQQDLNKAEAFNVKLKEQAEELQARIDQLQAQMESLKKVDLTIEKKKRERTNR